MLAAFLIEYPFYLVTGFASERTRLGGNRLPVVLLISAMAPYLAACCGAVQFTWLGAMRLAALALALSLWYVVLPARPAADLCFLALLPAVLLSPYFETIYASPYKDVVILGHLALIQIAVLALLNQRRLPDFGYGFLPQGPEWRIGAVQFVYFAVIGIPLALALKVVHFTHPAPVWKDAATFIGVLWVVALSEEFLFRGVLQHWIEEWTWSAKIALVATSALFGLMHLWFRPGFPNWRLAIVAGVLGFFCGRARNQAGTIRAGMVTHALVVTAWRAFFA